MTITYDGSLPPDVLILADLDVTPARRHGLKKSAGQVLLTGRLLCNCHPGLSAWDALFAGWGLAERLPLDATLAYGFGRPSSDSGPA